MFDAREAYKDWSDGQLRDELMSRLDAFAADMDPWRPSDEPVDLRSSLDPLLPLACDGGVFVDGDGRLYGMGAGAIAIDETGAFDLLWSQIQQASRGQLVHYVRWATAVESIP